MADGYPEGIDCLWIAMDQGGRVGAFITAGEGPVPGQAFGFEAFTAFSLEEMLLALGVSTPATLLVDVPRPDSFLALASRGVFVYDWGEFHHNSVGDYHSYRLVAVPEKPIAIAALLPDIAEIASAIHFPDVSFGRALVIDPRDTMACEESAA
ncbi:MULTISPECIES: hypothetical protein [Nitrospirillum]|uniref:Uncharacterized protein n=1 Tax=Nitrospirillum amazonense TaxID=28077 RepID=A0A560F5Z4_9PROT|nr:hypothetical protein [Nitrospirillum amazonense]MEC4593505.1 hypothetical protein [Nitrospirillum amazonense]TWB17043.1 hypothetical protein FBZ88_12740 [Nitrospirillum amazonense]